MDPLYIRERDSRKRVWNSLVELDEEHRRKPARKLSADGIREPLSIVLVEPDGESKPTEALKLCYQYVTYYRLENCSHRRQTR